MATLITTMDPNQYQTQHHVERRIHEDLDSLNIKESQVKKWIATNSLPAHFFRAGSAKRYYLTTEVTAWIAGFSGI